jgi:hypothetical protein
MSNGNYDNQTPEGCLSILLTSVALKIDDNVQWMLKFTVCVTLQLHLLATQQMTTVAV